MDDDDLMLAADWSELPGDLLGLIIDKLQENTFFLLDYIRFGAICFEWRNFFLCIQNYKQIKLPSNLPVLLFPSQFDDEEEDYNHGLDDEEEDNHEDEEEEEEHDDYQDDNHEDEEEEEHDDYQADNHEDEEEEEEEQDDNHEDEEEEHDDYHNHDHDFDHHDEEEHEHEHEHEHEEPLFYYHEPELRGYYYRPRDVWKGQDAEKRYKSTRSFYSLSEGKVNQHFQLPVPYYKNCRGSSHGWLITVDDEEQPDGTYTFPVRLLNPFRSVNNEIQLPPLTPIRGGIYGDEEVICSYYLLKAYLSANPSSLSNPSKDLLVLGVYGSNRFGFCRPGDSVWTHFPLENRFRPIEDLICYKGRFLAIIQKGSVLELDFAHHLPEPSVKFVALPPANGNLCSKKYLVESGGDLLQVERHNVGIDYSTTGFRAFKLNDDDASSNDDAKWVEMDNLDGRSLFLGDNSSISLSAADDLPGLMPNCIYFTDDNYEGYEVDDWDGPHDIGIFNFEDKSLVFRFGSIMPQPIWIQPML